MKNATLAALCGFSLYVIAGFAASALTSGLPTFLLGGLALWLAFRLAYAIEDMLG